MIKRDESRRACAYQDPLGLWTIADGILIDARKAGAGLRPEEMDFILDNRLRLIHDELDLALPWWEKLDEPRKAVMLDMVWNLGFAGLVGFHDTLSLIAAGKYEEAAGEMLKSRWATQVGPRAQRLATQMRTGQWT